MFTHPRIAIIGDIGGHYEAFLKMLDYAGVDIESATIPAGLSIIQVGDLVHKGLDSDACIQYAVRLLNNNPNQYVQLIGNHEAHYLGGPDVSHRSGVYRISEASMEILTHWWAQGIMKLSVALRTEIGDILVTHGGLTKGFYENDLVSPQTAQETSRRLNSIDDVSAFRPGYIMTGIITLDAGPLCPRTGIELLAPWLDSGSVLFHQIHGHEGVWWWPDARWHDDVPQRIRDEAVVDWVSRQSWLDIGTHRIWSIDPVFGNNKPERVPNPLILGGIIL